MLSLIDAEYKYQYLTKHLADTVGNAPCTQLLTGGAVLIVAQHDVISLNLQSTFRRRTS
jgi:hypothetical protein